MGRYFAPNVYKPKLAVRCSHINIQQGQWPKEREKITISNEKDGHVRLKDAAQKKKVER